MPTLNLLRILFVCFVYFLSNAGLSVGISCKDEDNKDVDWFIVYKLPKEGENSVYDGTRYAYLTSDNPNEWTLSSKSVTEQTSIMGRTWHDYNNKKKTSDTAFLSYNDNDEDLSNVPDIGITKGHVAFDTETGFWMVYSIPHFGEESKYRYPDGEFDVGHTAICITTPTSNLNEICNHLLYCIPLIHDRIIADSILQTLDDGSKTLFSNDPSFHRTEPFTRDSTLTSLGGVTFRTFAKNGQNQGREDLVGDILVESLRASLYAEAPRDYPSYSCDFVRKFRVIYIDAVKMTPANNKEDSIYFESTIDRSRWVIAEDSDYDPWVCITDTDRKLAHSTRGGGAICLKSSGVWNAFNDIVYGLEGCPGLR